MAQKPDRAPGRKTENPDVSTFDKASLIARIGGLLAAIANLIINLVRD